MEAPMLTQCPVTQVRIPHHQRVLRYALRTLLLIFALAGDDVVAQDFRGAIQGRVTDNSGASVPGVTVTALNLATNAVSTTTTNENGNYSVPFLPPGQYKIT